MARRKPLYQITLRDTGEPTPGERYTAALTVRLSPRTLGRFRIVCARAGRTMADVLRSYIADAIKRDGLSKERIVLPASPRRRKRRSDAGKPRPRPRDLGE